MPVRKKRIENLCREALLKAKITEPPVPVENIAANHGIRIRYQPLDSNVSGLIFISGQNAIIGVNSFHPKVRQRFTVAHELGHYLLHQDESVHVDRTVFAKLRSGRSSENTTDEEVEANLFAAELLMPGDFISQDLAHVDAVDIHDEEFIANLARRYKVSVQALVLRLNSLGYIEH